MAGTWRIELKRGQQGGHVALAYAPGEADWVIGQAAATLTDALSLCLHALRAREGDEPAVELFGAGARAGNAWLTERSRRRAGRAKETDDQEREEREAREANTRRAQNRRA